MIHNISRFIAALALLATAQGAWADTETVSYIDADGNEQTATATVLTGDVTADGLSTNAWGNILIPAGWYVVKNSKDGVDASYTEQLYYTGDNGTIHLILADGAEMTVSKSTSHAIYLDHGYPLAIYGQSGGTGRLTVTGESRAIYALGGMTINGGIVNVTDTGTGSSSDAIYVMNGITINGGQVTATTAGSGKGIYVYGAATALTIGCRKASDFVSYSSRGGTGTVNIKSGQTLYAGATAYSGDDVDVPTGTVTLRPYSSDDFSVNDAGTEYTILTAGGWNVFCDLLADNTMGYFSGKTVKLGDNITVTRMAGGQPFTGTFDGQNHTLTLDYGTADAPIDAQFVAPFVETANDGEHQPTFRNLTIAGSIYDGYTGSGDHNLGGLIGHLFGTVTIEHCTSLVEIHAKVGAGGFVGLCEHNVSFTDCLSSAVIRSADGSNSGFVAWSRASEYTIAFTGCLFDGKLLQQNGSGAYNGGFIGWTGATKTVTITNSLCAPAPLATGETMASSGSATFARGWNATTTATNSYYTAAFEIAQGKATRTVAADADVTIGAIALTGTATQYTVSGITAYSGGGLQRGQTLYYGSDDQLSLTLTTSAVCQQPGYQYAYTASAGTLSGTTLTMPDEDVTISVALAPIDWATVNQGSPKDPYMIYNKDQLLLLAHRVNGTNGETANDYSGKYFKLGADITFDHDVAEPDDYAENYESIGTYIGGTYRYFRGTFIGDSHTVSGIRIRKDGSDNADCYQGLFGRISSGAVILDVHLTDARITGCYYVGGIIGYNTGTGSVSGCTVTDSYITATNNRNYGTICGSISNTLRNNYYHGCTVNGTAATSGVGCQGADIADNHGALPAYRLDLGANITTPPGTFVNQTGWLATPPVGARLKAENGFTLAGNHYFASGYVFTPGSTLASGAAQGYTPRATLGGQLLDLYTPTGDNDLLAGKAIARLTITADCDGKTLASTEAIYSTGKPVTVAYIKADGTPGEASAIALDGHETLGEDGRVSLAAGTYYVGTDIAYATQILPAGNITLILADGKTMTLYGNTTGIDGYNLTIYGQSLDDATAGTLRYDGKSLGIYVSNYEQHSGNVSITTTGSTVSGIYAHVTLRGGTLTISADGNNAYAIYGNTHSILGGHLTANATGTNATGIYAFADDGTAITLGWTRPADRITASSISTEGGTVAVKDGQALTDGSGNIYTGTLTASVLSGFAAETTLQPCLALADAADNTAAITDHAGQTLAVALSGRTLYKDGSWNTLCLPFAVDLTASGTLSGDNVQAMTLNTTSSTFADGTLTLNFTAATTIPAGTPFIIKWDKPAGYVAYDGQNAATCSDLVSPVFNGVTIDAEKHDATVTGVLTFTGTYAPVTTPADGDNTKLYLGATNKLFYPTKTITIGTHRAYFQLLGDLTAGEPTSPQSSHVRAFNLNFGDDEATGIISVHDSGFTVNGSDAWYTLDGRRLDGQPTAKGLYIHGGKKVAIK